MQDEYAFKEAIVSTDLGVWIFDWLYQLSAVFAANFHGSYFTPGLETTRKIKLGRIRRAGA